MKKKTPFKQNMSVFVSNVREILFVRIFSIDMMHFNSKRTFLNQDFSFSMFVRFEKNPNRAGPKTEHESFVHTFISQLKNAWIRVNEIREVVKIVPNIFQNTFDFIIKSTPMKIHIFFKKKLNIISKFLLFGYKIT